MMQQGVRGIGGQRLPAATSRRIIAATLWLTRPAGPSRPPRLHGPTLRCKNEWPQPLKWSGQRAKEKRQTACKPGSVPASRQGMTIPLGRPLPDASRDRPGRRRENPPAGGDAGAPPLFGLAPGGVYRAVPVTGDAVRSYRTLSPLPAGRLRPRRAVCFLWHCPWGRPRRVLPGTVSPWSPDFPLPRRRSLARAGAVIRPSGAPIQ